MGEWVDLKLVSRIAYNNKLKREKCEQQKIEEKGKVDFATFESNFSAPQKEKKETEKQRQKNVEQRDNTIRAEFDKFLLKVYFKQYEH